MARPRAFDRDEVLDKAMAKFWSDGFHATSMQQLVDATGLNRASMYQNFHDKRGLFIAAVDHYIEQRSAKRLASVDSDGDPIQVIRDYFLVLMAAENDIERRRGCLLTNSAIELATVEHEIACRITQVFGSMHRRFEVAIERGQAEGSIRADMTASAIAGMLLGLLQGLRVLSRSGLEQSKLKSNVETALNAIR